METLLAKLRTKSKRQRQVISLLIAGIITLGILFLWYWNFHIPAAAPAAETPSETASSNDFSAS